MMWPRRQPYASERSDCGGADQAADAESFGERGDPGVNPTEPTGKSLFAGEQGPMSPMVRLRRDWQVSYWRESCMIFGVETSCRH
jgi:hypothetical protein